MASLAPLLQDRTFVAVMGGILAAGVLLGYTISSTIIPQAPIQNSSSKDTSPSPPPKIQERAITPEPESDSDEGELADFEGFNEECKLVLVVRTDLGMTKGTYIYVSPTDGLLD
jgi:hypothetical protein